MDNEVQMSLSTAALQEIIVLKKLNILSGQTLLKAGILRHTGTIIVQIEKSIFDQFFLAPRLQNFMGPSNTTF